MTTPTTAAFVPPHDLGAETALLGSMLLSAGGLVAASAAGVTVADFYSPENAQAFAAMVATDREGLALDPVVVAARLNGGANWPKRLREIEAATPASAHATEYAAIIRDCARRRELIAVSHEMEHAAREGRDVEPIAARLAIVAARPVVHREPWETLPVPVDWPAFWQRESAVDEFLIEGLIPKSRSVVIYAKAKEGKSLLMLHSSAALASGRPVLGQPAREPVSVMYLDMEMTEDDLRDRLEDLGYGSDDDLEHFHYFLLPTLPALDTEAGGTVLMDLCARHQPELVVIDTTGRVVAGAENDADTFRAFYRHTGARLKAAGIAVARLDHAGKDADRGQRGSSSKTEDVDVVWHLTADGSNVRLRATHKRLSWVPDDIHLTRVVEPFVTYRVAPKTWPAGTAEVAALLDQLDAPREISARDALSLLREHGEGRRREAVCAALRQRRERP